MDLCSKEHFTTNLLILIFLLFFGIALVCIRTPNFTSKPFLYNYKHQPKLSSNSSNSNNSTATDYVTEDELEASLRKASMADKTVIIAIINRAYVEEPAHTNGEYYPSMFDLFLEGFWVGEQTKSLLDHVLIVSMDQTAYERCIFRRLNCYRLLTDGADFTQEKLYMSAGFINMMWTRTLFLLDVLKRGYNFIFTDTDVIWLRSPFSRLSMNGTYDLEISTDKFNGDPRAEDNPINTGFYHIRANNKTISLFETWYGLRENATGLKEQDVLANLIHKGVIKELGLRVRFLDTLFFSGFCTDSKDVTAVATVHANCCRSITAKVADLTAALKDWTTFRNSADATKTMPNSSATNAFQWSSHTACMNSWASPKPTTVP